MSNDNDILYFYLRWLFRQDLDLSIAGNLERAQAEFEAKTGVVLPSWLRVKGKDETVKKI